MADNPYAKYANPYAGYVPVGVPDPTKPLDLREKQLNVGKSEATQPFDIEKAKAEAESARIQAQQAEEQWRMAHPQVSTSGLYGPDYLKTLPAPDQNMVRALAEGRLAFPSGFALKTPFWQEKLTQVAQYDPNFDATNYNARAKGRSAAISGKLGASNNALNTAIGHLGQLSDQISGTASHNFTPFNAVENAVTQTFGDPGVTNFKDTAAKLADELEAVYRNGGGAEQGVTRQLRSLDPNMSLAQKQGIVNNAMDLLASKMAANLSQYNFGTGGKPTWDMLDPHTLQVLHDKAPDLLGKYFAPPANGASGGAPPPGPNGGPPPVGGGGADYSGMVGGPQARLATGVYRNQFDPVMASTLSTFIKNGEPYDTAANFAQSHGFNPPNPQDYAAAVAFAKAHNGATNVQANKLIPTTVGERMAASPLAAAVAGAAGSGSAGLLDTAGRSLVGPAWDANRAALAETNPASDLLGNVAGGAAGMFGAGGATANLLRLGAKGGLARNALAVALKNPGVTGALGDTAYGAAYGANENPGNPLAGAEVGALGGLGGGIAGNALAAGTGAALRGVVNPAVDRLRAAGIPLTAGEVLGGGFKKAQDAMTSVFGPGNMVARRYADGRQALNQAAFNEAGNIIGAPINAVGQKGIQALDAAKNNAYSSALDPVSLDLNNPSFFADLRAARTSARSIPNVDQAPQLAEGALDNYIANPALENGGVMSGRDFQQGYRGLSRVANAKSTQDRAYGYEVGQSLGQGQDALVNALQEQNPGAYDAFLSANRANRHLSVLTDAVNAAKNQIGDNGEPLFTPAQLGTAATNNARTYSGKVAAASGSRPFNQLATDAQQVMSSKLPESGTFPRQLMGLALTGGISGAGGMFGGQANGAQGAAEGAAVPLGLLTLLGTRRGQQLLTGALLNRTAADQISGRYLMRNPQVGGSVLTAAGIPLLTGP